jgi:very-short-patch-repair endonuclease
MSRNIIIPYNPELKKRARELRNNPTLAEKMLWREIRGKQLGYEFHRQIPIDQFIVDFYCHELLLAVEVDGASHDSEDAKAKDLDRQARIENRGVSFLRFQDDEVINQLDGVVEKIKEWIEENN